MEVRRGIGFWQRIFIYCWIFSVVGHIFELCSALVIAAVRSQPPLPPIMDTTLPLALPYGFGVVALILFVIPLWQKHNLRWPVMFLLTIAAVTIVEYVCALAVVAVYGSNPYWSYAALPFNLQGQVSLGTSIIFAMLGMWFIYYLYPQGQKIFDRMSRPQITGVFWVLFVLYATDVVATYLLNR